MRKNRFILTMLAGTLALPFTIARATPITVVTAEAIKYIPGSPDLPQVPLQMEQGSTLEFVSLDVLGYHNITAYDLDEHDAPLFSSGDQIGPGERAVVIGAERLPPGTYKFFCTSHGPAMEGLLEVVPPAI